MRILSRLAVGLVAALTSVSIRTAGAAETGFPCAGSFLPLERRHDLPVLLTGLFLPLAVLDAALRDHLGEKPRKPVTVRVVGADGKPVRGARIGVLYQDKDLPRFVVDDEAGTVALPEGPYVVNAVLPGKAIAWGTARFRVGPGATPVVTVKLDRTLPAIAPVAVEAAVPGGAVVSVPLTGFSEGIYGLKADPGSALIREVWPNEIGQGEVALPAEAGAYRIVYMTCAPRVTLAEWPVRVGKPDIALDVPGSVTAGDSFEVTVRGRSGLAARSPELLGRKADDGARVYDRGEAVVGGGETARRYRLTAPPLAGRYRVVVSVEANEKDVLAERELSVAARTYVVGLPDAISLGERIKPELAGPSGISIELWALDKSGRPTRMVAEAIKGNTERFPAPEGRYEARLVTFSDGIVLARKTVTVTGRAFGDVAGEVARGGTLPVTFAMKALFFDKVGFLPAGVPLPRFGTDALHDVRNRTEFEVPAPAKPGRYDLVYVYGRPGTADAVIERVPVTVK
ncbi:carboxypeptidase-like regulatory domain-containing protein [Prosthecomicrobium hirschii]|uniref:carboxypeptidase-like regulatory domain-containing protein n=1 Tax=Prosthecodimorpha hirschii TaxID=665126 RepID=UPI0022203788|nr:carboxypeptidase-like regulatory domain-containing protein [Prosthecomicrobium hirschii]MCW1841414.1 carboxypeptidase-like regulatory domain-containing protein [Prosthecomicrobium hirschii]